MIRLTPWTVARIGGGLVVLVALIGVVGAYVREPIAAFAQGLVADLGVAGLFAAVVAMDAIPGLGFQPALFFGYTGGLPVPSLLVAAWIASLVASVSVYGLGRALRNSARIVGMLERWRVGGWLRDHGARAIAVAAVAPVPFGLATLGAGVLGVPLRALLLGASFRGVKIAATLGAIVLGWGMAA